jgi:hypothetical protein
MCLCGDSQCRFCGSLQGTFDEYPEVQLSILDTKETITLTSDMNYGEWAVIDRDTYDEDYSEGHLTRGNIGRGSSLIEATNDWLENEVS